MLGPEPYMDTLTLSSFVYLHKCLYKLTTQKENQERKETGKLTESQPQGRLKLILNLRILVEFRAHWFLDNKKVQELPVWFRNGFGTVLALCP